MGELGVGLIGTGFVTDLHAESFKRVLRANVLAVCRQLVVDAQADGYGEYRSHLTMMDQIADSYSWNDHAQRRLYESLKDALDPRGVLAPGKQGIWPDAMRDVVR